MCGRVLRSIQWVFIFALIGSCLLISAAWSDDGPPGDLTVTVEDGKLSISVRQAKFVDVINTVSQQSGIKFKLLGEIKDNFSDTFERLPLEQGLMRLMGGQNYICVYSAKGSKSILTHVIVLPPTEGIPSPPTPPASALKENKIPKGASVGKDSKPGEGGQNTPQDEDPFQRAIREAIEQEKKAKK